MRIGILGAGVAGLATAYFLRGSGRSVEIHEAADTTGGLARSFRWNGFDCDLGPHRLYTDDAEVLDEIGGLTALNRVRRHSRIHVQGRWLRDPVSAPEVLVKFPPRVSARIIASYLTRPRESQFAADECLDGLALARYGSGLNELFFKPYSEKLFGIPAGEIAASWGRRKLRLASWRDHLRRNGRLRFRHFYYPAQGGYGAICAALCDALRPVVRLQSRLVAIRRLADAGYRCEFERPGGTGVEEFDCVVSTLPVSYFAGLLGLNTSLRFRPLRLTYLLVKRARVSENHWIYFIDRDFVVNRVAEFKNFAPAGVGLPSDRTVLCCESTDLREYSVGRVVDELGRAGLARVGDVLDSKVIDLPQGYPIFDRAYEHEMARIERLFVDHPNVRLVGRNARFAHLDVDEVFAEARRVAREMMV
ncbi:MAG TPA: FAD-dependent oxidoreductase [Pirellulales bacterium]|nr:FAD-dependent oxidoreductase [Pirellulales bacterium]